MRIIQISVLAGWFFSYQHPIPGFQGARAVGVVGPFASEGACEEVRAELIGLEFPGSAFSKCIERKEA